MAAHLCLHSPAVTGGGWVGRTTVRGGAIIDKYGHAIMKHLSGDTWRERPTPSPALASVILSSLWLVSLTLASVSWIYLIPSFKSWSWSRGCSPLSAYPRTGSFPARATSSIVTWSTLSLSSTWPTRPTSGSRVWSSPTWWASTSRFSSLSLSSVGQTFVMWSGCEESNQQKLTWH